MIARMMLLISFRSGHCFLHFRMREWLSGGASPSQGEGRGFESRLALLKPPEFDQEVFLRMIGAGEL